MVLFTNNCILKTVKFVVKRKHFIGLRTPPSICSIMDSREFEWESQLRFYWKKEPDELIVMQCTGEFGYGYEYMGLNGRLVITPLTDRIYLTITQVYFC